MLNKCLIFFLFLILLPFASATVNLTVEVNANSPPSVPVLVAEPDQTGVSRVNLEWLASTDSEGDTIKYFIRVGTTTSGTEVIDSETFDLEYADIPVSPCMHYWSAKACDDAYGGWINCSDWSSEDLFKIDAGMERGSSAPVRRYIFLPADESEPLEEEAGEEEIEEKTEEIEIPQEPKKFEEVIIQKTKEQLLEREEINLILNELGDTNKELREKVLKAMESVKVSKTFELTEISNNLTEEKEYLSVIKLTIFNITNSELQDVTIIEMIPKKIAKSSSEIKSETKFDVLKEDPIIAWKIAKFGSKGKIVIEYSLNQKLNELLVDEIKTLVIVGGTDFLEELPPETAVPAEEIDLKWIIALLVILLAGILIFKFFRR